MGWKTGRSGFDPLQGANDFSSSLCVQTGSGAHPASSTVGMVVLFLRLTSGRGVTLTTHPHLLLRSRMIKSYIPLPPRSFVACSGTALALFTTFAFIIHGPAPNNDVRSSVGTLLPACLQIIVHGITLPIFLI
jgi:hypothetical protein